MSGEPSSAVLEDAALRMGLCHTLANQLEDYAEAFDRLEIRGWGAHLRRDAKFLRLRMQEEGASEPAAPFYAELLRRGVLRLKLDG
jgi:hypothetical protein